MDACMLWYLLIVPMEAVDEPTERLINEQKRKIENQSTVIVLGVALAKLPN